MTTLLAACLPGVAGHAAGGAPYASSTAALEEGLANFKRGAYAAALPALEFAASHNQFMAQFTLAQVYADNNGPETDHAKAYMLFQTIADEHSDADPDDDRRAPYVAKALTALAGYLQVGLPEIGLNPDPARAADYLHHAALFFGDEDAQFELVKLKLSGEGVPADIVGAKHWLAVLSQRGHAGAQAFLADLYFRGKFMEMDKVRAFALISVAVEHAPPRERIWIEDVYQNIFCGAGEGIRKQATGMVADWRARYGRKAAESQPSPLGPLNLHATRTCGDRVTPVEIPSYTGPSDGQGSGTGSMHQALVPGSTGNGGSLHEAGDKSVVDTPLPGLASPGLAQGLMPQPDTSPH